MSDESDDIQTVNQVVFTKSEFASTKWDGFVFDVVDVDDNGGTTKALDPKQITWKDKPIKIYIDQKRTIDDIEEENPDIKFDTSASEESLFAQVVLEISNLWNGMYYKKLPSVREMKIRSGSDPKTYNKWLHVAKKAGLYFDRGRRVRQKPKPSAKDLIFIAKFDEWLGEKPIEQWIGRHATAKYHKNQLSLFNAMKIMKVSPERLKQMATAHPENPQDSIAKIGDLMEDERYQDPRNESNILPESAMLEGWQLPKKFMVGNIHTKGAWYWVENYGLQGKPKVWYYLKRPTSKADAKELANHYANKKWSLRSWSIAPDAPDIDGDDQETQYQDVKTGKTKKANVWHGGARELTKGAIEREQENILYNYVGVIRQFLMTFGLDVGKQPDTSIWAQVANPARKATIHMDVDQIESVKRTLEDGMEGKIQEFDDWYNYTATKEKKIDHKDKEVSMEYWKDAHFYFLLSLELGFRAEEAFTIIGEETEQVEAKDKSGKSGVIEFANKDLMVQIYTRKGEKGKKGQKIHGGFILSEETKALVRARVKEIEEGMKQKTQKEADKFGVILEYRGYEYKENSLVGASGKYTVVGTLNLPTTEIKGKEGVEGIGTARDKIREIFRHCYHTAGLKDEYWYNHSLHSLRHVFAQYWLELSNYNYGFVARIGHWKTESIVREVYGKSQDWRTMQDMKDYATTNPFERLRELKKLRQKAPSQAEQQAIDSLGLGTESDLDVQDEKLREKIYFEGGDYYDVRLPESQRVKQFYPAGTDIQFIDKKMKKPTTVEGFFKYDKKKEDATDEEGVQAGE